MKSLIYYLLILNNIGILVVTKKKIQERPKNCTHVQVKVSLSSITEERGDGVMELRFLPDPHLHFVCFPSASYKSYRKSAMLSHVACRQLGYMTYETRYHQSFLSGHEPRSLLANVECSGHEQDLGQCRWKELELQFCPRIMAVTCTSCLRSVEASEGLIMNPGHPHAYFYTVYCEWLVTVPEGHMVSFTFLSFFLPGVGTRRSSSTCDESVSYVEISYADIGIIVNRKFCSYNPTKVVKVDHRRAKVRFFSGIFRRDSDDDEKYGFKMMFRAIPSDPPSTQPYKVILITSSFLVIFILTASCYCCRKWESRPPREVRGTRRTTSRPENSLQQLPLRQHPLGMNSERTELCVPIETLSQTEHCSSILSFSTPLQSSSLTTLDPQKDPPPKGGEFPNIATPYSTPQVMPEFTVEESDGRRRMSNRKVTDSLMAWSSNREVNLKDCSDSIQELPSSTESQSPAEDPSHYTTLSMASTEGSERSVTAADSNLLHPIKRIRPRQKYEGSGSSMHSDEEEQSSPLKLPLTDPDVKCKDDATGIH